MAVEILKIIVLLILLFVVTIVVGIINKSYDSRKFNEEEMRRVLQKYVPDGEKLIAGVHGYGAEVKIMFEILGNCSFDGEVYPAERGMAISGYKAKYAGYDVYLGITEHRFLFRNVFPETNTIINLIRFLLQGRLMPENLQALRSWRILENGWRLQIMIFKVV